MIYGENSRISPLAAKLANTARHLLQRDGTQGRLGSKTDARLGWTFVCGPATSLTCQAFKLPQKLNIFSSPAQPGLKDVGFCRALTILAQTRTQTTPCKVFLVWCFYLPFLIVAFHSWQQSKLNRKSFCRPLRATNSPHIHF